MPFVINVQSRYSDGPDRPIITSVEPTPEWILEHVVDWAQSFEKPPRIRRPAPVIDGLVLFMEWEQDELQVAVHDVQFADVDHPIA